jgi:D-alanyl-lipoteichoic acid acyltransferase DltB (MBOAT superfamily)
MVLLVASCYFYMAFIPAYILILLITILIDYFAAIWIEEAQEGTKKTIFLVVSILSTCLVLFVFKYYNFFCFNINALAALLHWNYSVAALKLILPIGLSFHTFQSLSYVIEVYHGHQKAERHFGIYSLYVMFYPQLVAGPIERPQNLLHQFYEEHHFDYQRVREGFRLILWGMVKKVVIADQLANCVNPVYNNPDLHNGTTLILATVFFSFQIYCDFSGYSEIAIGAAKVMGFELMQNFNRPYFAQSVAEFWKRWHISLSTWFKDYLYISLGGNRVGLPRWYFNLFLTFLVSGLWHGANWTYVIWGALNGIYLILGVATAPIWGKYFRTRTRLGAVVGIVGTYCLTCAAWVFFRAASIQDAQLIFHKVLFQRGSLFIGTLSPMAYSMFGIVLLVSAEFKQEYFPNRWRLLSSPNVWLRWSAYIFLVLCILLIGVFDGGQFIYFQF